MAGSFEQINSRVDFFSELKRARDLCNHLLQTSRKEHPILQSVKMQLEFLLELQRLGRVPTRKERKSITMGTMMYREFEDDWDEDVQGFRDLVMLLGMYIKFWPSDTLAADPNNEDKIDWYKEW